MAAYCRLKQEKQKRKWGRKFESASATFEKVCDNHTLDGRAVYDRLEAIRLGTAPMLPADSL
jgi:hypothetical protein